MLRILFIADQAISALDMKVCLKQTGQKFVLTSPGSFDSTLQYLTKAPQLPDIIIIEIGRKSEAAHRFMKALSTNPALLKIPLVVLTDIPDSTEKGITSSLNVIGYYVRPVDYSEVTQLINEMYSYANV